MPEHEQSQPQVCPYTGALSVECNPEDHEIVADPTPTTTGTHADDIQDRHILWHLHEAVRLGELIDNGDGTFSLPPAPEFDQLLKTLGVEGIDFGLPTDTEGVEGHELT